MIGQYIVVGICLIGAGYLTLKISTWYRRKFDNDVVSYVLENPELREKLRKLL